MLVIDFHFTFLNVSFLGDHLNSDVSLAFNSRKYDSNTQLVCLLPIRLNISNLNKLEFSGY